MKAHRKKQKRLKPKKQEYHGKELFPRNNVEILAQVKILAEPLCEAEGMELVHVEYQREPGGRILRVYIDKSEGVTLDDCANINSQLSDILDVKLKNIMSYNLEVSSPGPDRPLGKLLDFERFKNRLAKIRTTQPIEGQNKFKGVLLGTSEGTVKILVNDKTIVIPFEEINRARLINYNGEN